MSTLSRAALLVGALTATACAAPPAPPPPPDTRAADEAAIRAADKEWVAAAQAKDAEKFASFYAEGGTLLLAKEPVLTGKAAIREAVTALMQDPHFALSFAPDKVVVARSGDLAYETGTYDLTVSDARKKPLSEKGHYVVVWQKQGDGGWKAVQDLPVAGRPEPAPNS